MAKICPVSTPSTDLRKAAPTMREGHGHKPCEAVVELGRLFEYGRADGVDAHPAGQFRGRGADVGFQCAVRHGRHRTAGDHCTGGDATGQGDRAAVPDVRKADPDQVDLTERLALEAIDVVLVAKFGDRPEGHVADGADDRVNVPNGLEERLDGLRGGQIHPRVSRSARLDNLVAGGQRNCRSSSDRAGPDNHNTHSLSLLHRLTS